ncbi:similar to Saccharomyces cerevisiae YPR171W BSP1 Adapter that links synaptojanins Inp52p and Inp53p to the cortical actin cytoskeleton [Maudiozyma saulgeensis]|uniref:Similar to Saccharomyces cerevisiae YPR171W BSP1 Adapter that links synaptojanins Inp52p and Inp53p to the cortical actin cytoskeleton n=1 Tax=Maudiozyma saulgeensis TaxID=1789683 RepID=A0A1X7R2E8_9SACH|nr:similar to Saccharomyces cerevisiae YPR171W BSP1 Adapter that links synaptojanins Inp52p and Inp53p to the cortical actin cytoskeleton [Kazachstania saulgeensis]
MGNTKIHNDPELDDFLRRTHEIDNERKQKRSNKPPAPKPKPKYVSQRNQFNENDLEEARKILQSSDILEFNEEMVVDGSEYDDNNNHDDLTFKSAYNYEKTFSPKKKNYSLDELDLEHDESNLDPASRKPQNNDSNMEFSVSKEDFLLLQRIKKNRESKIDEIKPKGEIPPKINKFTDKNVPKETLSPRKKTMPTRGKPRAQNVKIQYDIEIDMDAPSLPLRKSQRNVRDEEPEDHTTENGVYMRRFNRINNERSSSPRPQLPSRPASNHPYTPTSRDVESEGGSSEDEQDKPSLPSRGHARHTNSAKRDLKEYPPATKPKPNFNKSTKEIVTSKILKKDEPVVIRNVMPEPMSTIELIDEEADLLSFSDSVTPPSTNNKKIDSNISNNSLSDIRIPSTRNTNSSLPPAPPTSRKSNETTTFIESLNHNKLTETHKTSPETPKKKVELQGIDYLDSVQLKSPSPHVSPSNSQKPSPIKPRVSKLPRSESFIHSALNCNLETGKKVSPPIGKDKPALPTKPLKFTNKETVISDTEDDNEMTDLKTFRIKNGQNDEASTKIPPKVPKKNSNIKLPILKPVEIKPVSTKAKKSLNDEHKLELPKLRSVNGKESNLMVNGKKGNKPDVPKRKPTIPEALVNAKLLKKTNIDHKDSSAETQIEPTPEALTKKNTLSSIKVAPAIPERKISLPEALKRANQLKSQTNQSKVLENTTNQPINVRLESVMALHQRKTFNGYKTPSEPTPIRRISTTVSSSSSSSSSSTPLVHVTKGRAKGPRRKLPSKI